MTQLQATECGHVFDLELATEFDETCYFNGSNQISNATGDQWDHQTLYRTVHGAYVLRSWSQRQGVRETWEVIDNEIAYTWLARCGYVDELPADRVI